MKEKTLDEIFLEEKIKIIEEDTPIQLYNPKIPYDFWIDKDKYYKKIA